MNNQSQVLSVGISDGSVDLGGSVIQVSTEVVVINPDGSVFGNDSKNDKLLMIIIIATAVPALIIIIALAGYCYIKRKRERVSAVHS